MEEIEDWQADFEMCIYAQKLLDKVIYLNSIVKVAPGGYIGCKEGYILR